MAAQVGIPSLIAESKWVVVAVALFRPDVEVRAPFGAVLADTAIQTSHAFVDLVIGQTRARLLRLLA